jgi:hypothetical protein
MAARNSASPQGSNMRRAMLDLMSAATGMVRFADHFLGILTGDGRLLDDPRSGNQKRF